MKSIRVRNYCFTAFEKPPTTFDDNLVAYVIYQTEEAPSTKKIHWQGYIELKKALSFSKVQGILGSNAHLEPRKGTQQQAIDYCCKIKSQIEKPFEWGIKKMQGNRSDLDSIYDAIIDGCTEKEILHLFEGHAIRYGNLIHKAIAVNIGLSPLDAIIITNREIDNNEKEIKNTIMNIQLLNEKLKNCTEVAGNTEPQLCTNIKEEIKLEIDEANNHFDKLFNDKILLETKLREYLKNYRQ